MAAMASAARRRREILELMLVAIYFVLTAYLFVCHSPPPIGFVLREAVGPFQIKARARNAGAEAEGCRLALLTTRKLGATTVRLRPHCQAKAPIFTHCR